MALRTASFGAGWVTTNRHIPAMRRVGGFDLRTLVDRHPERSRAAAAALRLPRGDTGTSIEDLPDRDSIDVVTIGTDPFSHAALIEGALEAGKHVICEKPLTLSVSDAERLAKLAETRDRVLAVVHNFQFARSSIELRRWMAQGRLGELRAIWAIQLSNPERRLPRWFDDLPLGLFYDESPHLLYLIRALAGDELEVDQVSVHPSTIGLVNTPAHVTAGLTSASGLPLTVQMSFEAPVSEWHVAVIGENGMGVVDVFRDIAVFVPNDHGHGSIDVLRTSAAATWHHWRGYLKSGRGHMRKRLLYGNDTVFTRFRDAAVSGDRPEGIGAGDALAVIRLQHRIIDMAGANVEVA